MVFVLQDLGTVVSIVTVVGAFIGGFITLIWQLIRINHHFQESRRKDAEDARAQYFLAVEGRRLDKANIVVNSSLKLITPPASGQIAPSSQADAAQPFLVFRLPLRNEGDGPVDILASLVSARVLSNTHKPGIGLRRRDVEWDDY